MAIQANKDTQERFTVIEDDEACSNCGSSEIRRRLGNVGGTWHCNECGCFR